MFLNMANRMGEKKWAALSSGFWRSWCLFLAILVAALIISGCTRSPEAKRDKFLELGKKEFAQKDYARAILDFKNAVAEKPSDAEAHYQLALAHLAARDLMSGIGQLREATRLNPKHAAAQVKLAELMAASGNKEIAGEAVKRMLQVLASSPDNVDALNTLAIAEWTLGKPDEAEQHLQQALEKLPQGLKSSVTLARMKLARNDPKAAENILKKAAAQKPASADALIVLGSFYLSTGRLTEAEQQFRQGMQADAKNAGALLGLAAVQLRNGQEDQAEQTYQRISALPDKQYRPFHAAFLFRKGKQAAAIAEFEKLAKEDQKDRAARSRLVTAYLLSDRQPDAERVLGEAIKASSKDADALLQRSIMYLGMERYEEAARDLTKVLQLRSYPAQAHYLLSKVYGAQGAVPNQKQELGEALKAKPDFVPARIELARLLVGTGAAKSALQLLDERPAPKNLNFILQRNWALIALNDQAELRKGIDRGLAIAKAPDLLIQEAILKLRQQDVATGQALLGQVLDSNPGNVTALDILAQSYLGQKQAAAAKEKIREYVSKSPKSASVQLFWGQFLVHAGDRKAAREAFAAARTLSKRPESADLALASLDIAEGKLDDARKKLSTVLAVHPANLQAQWLLAIVEEESHNYLAAVESYRKVLESAPDNVFALNNLAYLLAEYGAQPDEALKYAQHARELMPDDAAVADTLGWVLFRKGMFSTALPHLENAVAKEGTARRKFHLAIAYLKLGDTKRGYETLQSALQMDPTLPEAKLALQMAGAEAGR